MAYYLLFIVALVGLDQFVKYCSANIAWGPCGFVRLMVNQPAQRRGGLEHLGQQWFFT